MWDISKKEERERERERERLICSQLNGFFTENDEALEGKGEGMREDHRECASLFRFSYFSPGNSPSCGSAELGGGDRKEGFVPLSTVVTNDLG
ncbi:hypothetical protein CSUI_003511 [Cystoisospora suis]|uniref:Uncharacterized protein n=1 Tax=Cystoisospora suis TaxID=483139 RepID=A0A2C6L415_9APIC|nr:hypothetical protein CSUI_003511 [Cystoisospora suis]